MKEIEYDVQKSVEFTFTPKMVGCGMLYDYVYPSRPKETIPPSILKMLDASGKWLAERKYNGDRVVIHISPSRLVTIWNRYKAVAAIFNRNVALRKQIAGLNLKAGIDYWLDAEGLQNHTTNPDYKGKIVLFDLLVEDKFLYKPNVLERYERLFDICNSPKILEPKHGIALQVDADLWLAPVFRTNFTQHFKEMIHLDEIEGLVAKRLDSSLNYNPQKATEVSWQIRCRKANKNYRY